jgi:hypothetical protein
MVTSPVAHVDGVGSTTATLVGTKSLVQLLALQYPIAISRGIKKTTDAVRVGRKSFGAVPRKKHASSTVHRGCVTRKGTPAIADVDDAGSTTATLVGTKYLVQLSPDLFHVAILRGMTRTAVAVRAGRTNFGAVPRKRRASNRWKRCGFARMSPPVAGVDGVGSTIATLVGTKGHVRLSPNQYHFAILRGIKQTVVAVRVGKTSSMAVPRKRHASST